MQKITCEICHLTFRFDSQLQYHLELCHKTKYPTEVNAHGSWE